MTLFSKTHISFKHRKLIKILHLAPWSCFLNTNRSPPVISVFQFLAASYDKHSLQDIDIQDKVAV